MSDVEFDTDQTEASSLDLIRREVVTMYKPTLLVRLGYVKDESTSLKILLTSAIVFMLATVAALVYTYKGNIFAKPKVTYREDLPKEILDTLPKEIFDRLPSRNNK